MQGEEGEAEATIEAEGEVQNVHTCIYLPA